MGDDGVGAFPCRNPLARPYGNQPAACFAAGRTTQTPTKLALSKRLGGWQRGSAAAEMSFTMSKVVQLRAAVAPRGFALPHHFNLMSSDANNRAGSARLTISLAHPNDAVA